MAAARGVFLDRDGTLIRALERDGVSVPPDSVDQLELLPGVPHALDRLRTAGFALIAISFLIQIASLMFWVPLEIYQMETLGHPAWVIALRFKNIVAFALGKMEAWGLTNHSMVEDPWDYVHITCWNFLPFVLRRAGNAPAWVVNTSFAIWGIALAALAWTIAQLRRLLFSAR